MRVGCLPAPVEVYAGRQRLPSLTSLVTVRVESKVSSYGLLDLLFLPPPSVLYDRDLQFMLSLLGKKSTCPVCLL